MALVRFINSTSPNKVQLFNNLLRITKQKNITNYIEPAKQIGRWCNPKNNRYIETATLIMDRSNEDHCGSCGNGLLTNNPDINYHIINNNDSIIKINIFTNDERYYFPFTI